MLWRQLVEQLVNCHSNWELLGWQLPRRENSPTARIRLRLSFSLQLERSFKEKAAERVGESFPCVRERERDMEIKGGVHVE